MSNDKTVVVTPRANGVSVFADDEVSRTLSWDFGKLVGVVSYTYRARFADEKDVDWIGYRHGMKQKIADAAAKSPDAKTGAKPTAKDKFDAMQKVAEDLRNGKWNGGGAAPVGQELRELADAIAVARKVPADAALALVKSMTSGERQVFAAEKDIRGEIEKARAAAVAGVDKEALKAKMQAFFDAQKPKV